MRKSRLVTIGIVAGSVLGVACLVGLTVWTVSGFGASAAKTKTEWAKWQANGLPTTRDEVSVTKRPAKEESAEPILRAAAALDRKAGRPQPPLEFNFAESYHTGLRQQFVQGRQDVIAKYIEASKTQGFQYDTNWDRPSEFRFRRLGGYNPAWLIDDALFRAKTDWRGAVRRPKASRRLSSFQRAAPSADAQADALAVDIDALDTAGMCASLLADNPEAIRALREAIEETHWEPVPVEAIRADLYEELVAFRMFSDQQILDFAKGDMDVWEPMRRSVREGPPPGRLSGPVFAEIMSFWNEFYPQYKAESPDADAIFRLAQARLTAMETSKSTPERIASQRISPDYRNLFEAAKHHRIEQRLATAFLRILEYRSIHKKWPPNLKAVGADAIDEMDGKPLRFRVDGASARVWSVAPGQEDNQGVTPWEAEAKKMRLGYEKHDNAYIHPWPPRPRRQLYSSKY